MKILLAEANLKITKIILNARQRKFSVKLVALTDENLAKNILPITFKKKINLYSLQSNQLVILIR